MSGLAMLGWGSLLSLLAMLMFLGAAPVFVVRCVALLYGPSDPRRAELVGEAAHVANRGGIFRQWMWLGSVFGLGITEGVPTRVARRRQSRRLEEMTVSKLAQIEAELGGVEFAGASRERMERLIASRGHVEIKLHPSRWDGAPIDPAAILALAKSLETEQGARHDWAKTVFIAHPIRKG